MLQCFLSKWEVIYIFVVETVLEVQISNLIYDGCRRYLVSWPKKYIICVGYLLDTQNSIPKEITRRVLCGTLESTECM